MRKYFYTVLVVALAACSKTAPDPVVSVLEEKTFSVESGRFMVLVKGSGVWGVSTSDEWVHVQERYYKDEAAFEIRFDSNESTVGDHRFCRIGKVYVSSWDGSRKDEVIIRQEGLVPEIVLTPVTVGTEAGTCAMPMDTNLSDRERKGLSFSCDAEWISGISFGRDGRSIIFQAAAGSGRSATLQVTFTDAWGRQFTASSTVNQ